MHARATTLRLGPLMTTGVPCKELGWASRVGSACHNTVLPVHGTAQCPAKKLLEQQFTAQEVEGRMLYACRTCAPRPGMEMPAPVSSSTRRLVAPWRPISTGNSCGT